MTTNRNIVTLIPTDDPAELVVEPRGMDKVFGFRARLTIPLAHVRGATFDPDLRSEPKGIRGPGLGLPGKLVGTFHEGGRRQFWNISGYESTLVVTLQEEEFETLYLSVDDPEGLARTINTAVRAR